MVESSADESYAEGSVFVNLLGSPGRAKMLEVFLGHYDTELTESEVAELAGVAPSTVNRNIETFENAGLIEKTRNVGAQLYQLNTEHPVTQALGKAQEELLEYASDIDAPPQENDAQNTDTTAEEGSVSRLEAYHFYEHEWDSYEQLYDEFEWEIPSNFNIARYICDRWADDEGRVALFTENKVGEERSYTFGEMQEITNQLANHLEERGVERGDRVGVNAPQKPETVFSHIAAWKLGAVSVPLSTLFGPDALSYRLNDSGAVACIVDESNVDNLREVRDDLDSLETVLTIDASPEESETDVWDAIDGVSSDHETAITDPDEDAIVIYTSGTTGEPKGVRHGHRVLLGHLPLFVTTFCNMEMNEDDVFWTPSEWAWIAPLFNVLFPGLYYGRPVLAYNSGPFDADETFSLIEKYEITNFFAPPTALRMMMEVDTEGYDVEATRVIMSGGESLSPSIVDWAEEVFFGAAVHEGYGQTEANLLIGDCTALTEFREGKIGCAAPGMEVEIVDTETAEHTIETGEIGEIAVRHEGNPVCFKEYWRKPERTERKVQNGWLLTKDLGSVDEDGYFTFKSRKDDAIISAGYRIGPEEVEETLVGHEAVADSAVIGTPDDERGEVPKAFVVLAEDYEPSADLEDELQEHVQNSPENSVSRLVIEFVREVPTTSTGRLDRGALREWNSIEEGWIG
jgi:acetyl-CoA synthetase